MCIELLEAQPELEPLQLSPNLESAAKHHSSDLEQSGQLTHRGSDGLSLTKRIEKFTQCRGRVGENLYLGTEGTTGYEILISLLLQGLKKNSKLRSNIFGQDINFIGVGCAPHPSYGLVCVINYASELGDESEDDPESVGPVNSHPKEDSN